VRRGADDRVRSGVTLRRATSGDIDWVDVATNKTYDAVGSGMPDSQFAKQWPTVKSRITHHLTYADYVPLTSVASVRRTRPSCSRTWKAETTLESSSSE
jgi:hypothetical protein